MMGRALLIVGAMATLGLVAAAVLGYMLPGPVGPDMSRHVLVSLASCLLLLFSHCWIMFYLIGTGKAIKDAVNEHKLDADLIEEAAINDVVEIVLEVLAMEEPEEAGVAVGQAIVRKVITV